MCRHPPCASPRPGSNLPRPRTAGTEPAGRARLGYARATTPRHSLDSLAAAEVTRIFSEKISTRATKRPELEKAVTLAREIRATDAAVTVVIHEHKRLGRSINLATLAEELCASDIGLEFLTGELAGLTRPGRRRLHRAGRAVRDGTRVHPRPRPRGPRVRPPTRQDSVQRLRLARQGPDVVPAILL
ncbi:recombinase family protein [Streptomyces anulatus]